MTSDKKSSQSVSVTADDVAKVAGVSRWTVNRAFKKDASISEKSRLKVMEAAEQLGYLPDLLAASLSSDKSYLVALIIDDFANPHKLEVLEVLVKLLRANGWDTMLVSATSEETSNAILGASQRRVDAAVLIGSGYDDKALSATLGSKRVRKFIIFLRESELDNTFSICVNDRLAMHEIADYLLGKRYLKPHFLAGPQTRFAHLSRRETFISHWLDVTGITPSVSSVAAYDYQLAFDHTIEMLVNIPRSEWPDVMVCENDVLAFGAIDAIRYNLGLRVPEDISVTGFDDLPLSAGPHYNLTTYRQPLEEMAVALIKLLSGAPYQNEITHFKGSLVPRNSA